MCTELLNEQEKAASEFYHTMLNHKGAKQDAQFEQYMQQYKRYVHTFYSTQQTECRPG